jgi:hypothetical protein
VAAASGTWPSARLCCQSDSTGSGKAGGVCGGGGGGGGVGGGVQWGDDGVLLQTSAVVLYRQQQRCQSDITGSGDVGREAEGAGGE